MVLNDLCTRYRDTTKYQASLEIKLLDFLYGEWGEKVLLEL